MAVAKTVFIASDGSQWDTEDAAAHRDAVDVQIRQWEALLPEPPKSSRERIAVVPALFQAVKEGVVALCREEFPTEPVFKHDAMEIHPFSYAGRFLDGVGGPLRRIWYRFMCYRDGWMYEQPYFAMNPEKFEGTRP